MYLKPESYSYRRRRRSSFWRILVLLALIAGGIYLLVRLRSGQAGNLTTFTSPAPLPTPTRSAVSFAAEAADLYRAGRLTESIAAYQQALDLEPNQPELYVTLARLTILRGRPERGLELAREALRFEEDNAMAWALIGMAHDWLGMPGEAVDICERAISLDPTLPEAYAYLAEAYVDLGNWLAANNTIDTALELDENNVDVLRNYAYILEVQGNYTGAIAAYRQALEQHSSLTYIYMALGRNQQALGDAAGAKESYEMAADIDPQSATALDALGWSYMLEGDYTAALRNFEQALDVDATHSRALGHIATLYFQRRNYEDAIPAFEEAVRYGEAEVRRRAAFFRITSEPANQIPDAPSGDEVVVGEFAYSTEPLNPMRAVFGGEAEEDASPVQGYVRLNPLDGRYQLRVQGLPSPPAGQVYVGWFEPLSTADGGPVRTEPLTPDAQGGVALSGITGPVKGPPIEHYYTLALCYYFLDQCPDARPYIDVALRIDPEDANALQTLSLCGG